MYVPSQTCFARESALLTEMDTPQNVSRADTLVTLVTADRRLPSLVAVYLAAAPSTRASESSVMPATDLLAQDTSFPAGWGGREREECVYGWWRLGGGIFLLINLGLSLILFSVLRTCIYTMHTYSVCVLALPPPTFCSLCCST